jgi:flavin-binding protein dodecin
VSELPSNPVADRPRPTRRSHVADNVHSKTEIVGTSETGLDDAIRGAVSRASKTLDEIGWFEVTEIRGEVRDGDVQHVQVSLGIGFALADTKP